jgi:hypothetical protein
MFDITREHEIFNYYLNVKNINRLFQQNIIHLPIHTKLISLQLTIFKFKLINFQQYTLSMSIINDLI